MARARHLHATATTGTSASSAAPAVTKLEKKEKRDKKAPTGTTVSFMPDADIFEEVDFDFRVLAQRLRETAFLTKNLRIELNDERADGESAAFQYAGGIKDFVAYINRDKDAHPPQHHLPRERDRRRPGRGRDAVELVLQRVHLHVRQQHQHDGGRRSSVGLPRRPHAHDQRLRAPEEPPQGEGGEPLRRGRARGPHGAHLGEAAQPAVRGPDQDQARQHRDPHPGRDHGQREARRVPRREPLRGPADRREDDQRGAGAQRRAQGARPHAPQGSSRGQHAPRQARRLLHQGPGR